MTPKPDISPLEAAIASFRSARVEFDAAAREIPFEQETQERQEKILACRRNPEEGKRRLLQAAERKTAQFGVLQDSRRPDLRVPELLEDFNAAKARRATAAFIRENAFEIELAYRNIVANITLGAQETRLIAGIMDEVTVCKSALGKKVGRVQKYVQELASNVADEDKMFDIYSRAGRHLQKLQTRAESCLPSGYRATAPAKSSRFGDN